MFDETLYYSLSKTHYKFPQIANQICISIRIHRPPKSTQHRRKLTFDVRKTTFFRAHHSQKLLKQLIFPPPTDRLVGISSYLRSQFELFCLHSCTRWSRRRPTSCQRCSVLSLAESAESCNRGKNRAQTSSILFSGDRRRKQSSTHLMTRRGATQRRFCTSVMLPWALRFTSSTSRTIFILINARVPTRQMRTARPACSSHSAVTLQYVDVTHDISPSLYDGKRVCRRKGKGNSDFFLSLLLRWKNRCE